MNIAPTFNEDALLELSSMQRLTLRAAYLAAKREQTAKWYEAKKLREYIDKYAGYLFPCGDLEQDVRGLIEAAWQARAKARDIRARIGVTPMIRRITGDEKTVLNSAYLAEDARRWLRKYAEAARSKSQAYKPEPADPTPIPEARKRLREELHILLGPAEAARIDRIVDALEELIVAVTEVRT